MESTKKITILIIFITLIGAGVLVYKFVIKKSASPQSTTTSTVNEARQQEFYDAINKSSATDKDMDGISDSEEAKYQTSIDNSDTDGDGLSDSQEVFIYKTNPLKADTDEDGFNDGYEVRRGLNPLVKNK